jgi:5-methyltetrahydropteroyltriglutamate--homocysteine methyltransferase
MAQGDGPLTAIAGSQARPWRWGGLATSVVGSHAHPSWFAAGLVAAERGELGPDDLAEMLDDAVDTALRDQEEAGIDVVTDGEMRRAGFFTAEFYRHLTGVRALPSPRRLGPGGHDQQHRFEVTQPITAPGGLGVVAEYRFAVTRTRRPLKVTLPGPYTLSGRLRTGPGEIYRDRVAASEAFLPILRAELVALADAGAAFIQLDEPSAAIHPDAPADFAALFNEAVAPIVGRVRLAAHLCFGNYLGRPLAKRTYRPILEAMLDFPVDELVLEFANREMAEVEVAAEITTTGRFVAAGVIDVKNYYVESASDVAERTERLLAAGVPAERLTLVPDCGFSQTARWATRAKLRALGAGRDLVAGRVAATTVPTPDLAASEGGTHR